MAQEKAQSTKSFSTEVFNTDGKSDVLLQNDSGQAGVGLLDGLSAIANIVVGANPGPSWHVIGSADFNGDGKADILWQNTDGTPGVWLMDGFTMTAGANVAFDPGASWHILPQHHDLLV